MWNQEGFIKMCCSRASWLRGRIEHSSPYLGIESESSEKISLLNPFRNYPMLCFSEQKGKRKQIND